MTNNRQYAIETLRQLHKITADAHLPLTQKIDRLLALGCKTFDLPLAIVSKIEGNCYTVEYSHTPGGEVAPGDEFELGKTYCTHTLHANGPTSFSEAGHSSIKNHPCYEAFGLESYIGIPIIVNNERFGTLNFSGPEVHTVAFTEDDHELIRLFGQWVENELSRQQAFQEIRQQSQLLESMSQLVRIGSWRLDLKTENIYWSPVTREIHEVGEDYTPELANAIEFYKAGESRERITELVQKGMEEGTPWSEELQIVTAKGREVWVNAMGQPEFEDGKCVGLFGTFQDIDERVKSNLQLKEAKEAAEAAAKAKSVFLANMSHEIRTPMNGVIGILDLLQRSELSSQQLDQVNIAKSSADALLTLLNDILDFSKIEAGKLGLEQINFDLRELFESTVASLKTLADEKSLALTLDHSQMQQARVNGDPGRIRQILLNLIGNALKFTDSGEVSISAKTTSENGALRIWVEVKDTGLGIESDNLAHLFDAFTQEDASTTRKFGGTGLGLAIVSQLCQLMDGNVEARSELGTGSCFSFNLLLKPEQSEISTFKEHSTDFHLDASKMKILLVEDNKVNQLVAQQLLQMQNLDCDIAENGAEALLSLNECDPQSPYTLIFMDCQMPVMDGYEATQKIRTGAASDRYRDIPIVAMTANAMQGDREKCLNAGMNDYMSKPIKIDSLLDCLKRHTQ